MNINEKSELEIIVNWLHIATAVVAIVKFLSFCVTVLFDFDHFVQALVEFMVFVIASIAFLALRDWLEYIRNDHRPLWKVYQDALEATQAELQKARLDYLVASNSRNSLLDSMNRMSGKLKISEGNTLQSNQRFDQASKLLETAQTQIKEKNDQLSKITDEKNILAAQLVEKSAAILTLIAKVEELKLRRSQLVDL